MTTSKQNQGGGKPIPQDFPPVVYLPCVETVADPAQARVAMRTTRDGRVALLAYTALDRLHTCCGRNQPWIVMPTAGLDELQKAQPFQLLLLDVVIPEDQRQEGAA
ncbi:SAV_915 family protein [Saccharopolyspora taberi]|uniref:SseB protein N-terminal domain-containing protein n=1 Tax=Saccharopolyspora taberi TaxID=60895 RepID=A0ABN3V7D7_9PSEU